MRTRRIRAASILSLVAALIIAAALTGGLRQYGGERLTQLSIGDSIETSLVHVDIHALSRDDESILARVRATVIADHPVSVSDVFAFRVDGERERPSGVHANDVLVSYLNPQAPIELELSYRLDDGQPEAELLILDGRWQTQNENALALPDHSVLITPVAVVAG